MYPQTRQFRALALVIDNDKELVDEVRSISSSIDEEDKTAALADKLKNWILNKFSLESEQYHLLSCALLESTIQSLDWSELATYYLEKLMNAGHEKKSAGISVVMNESRDVITAFVGKIVVIQLRKCPDEDWRIVEQKEDIGSRDFSRIEGVKLLSQAKLQAIALSETLRSNAMRSL